METILSPSRRFYVVLAAGVFICLSMLAMPSRAQDAPGSLDGGFNAGLDLANGLGSGGAGVFSLAAQSDGKVYLGGAFGGGYGALLSPFVRLNADGSLDAAYNRPIIESYNTRTDDIVTAIDNSYVPLVTALTPLSNGKLLAGGNFYFVNGVSGYGGLVRLNADGSVDSSFKPPRFSGTIYTVVPTSDGKYFVGGDYSEVNGRSNNCLVRLKSNGSLDDDFSTGGFASSAAGGNLATVRGIAVLGDGKLVVAGQFSQVGQNSVTDLARLNKDGSFDKSYQGSATITTVQGSSPNQGDQIFALALQTDSKLLVSVQVITGRTNIPNSLYRLNTDGTLDTTFNPGGKGTAGDLPVNIITLQTDGKILIGGNFTGYNGASRNFLARLKVDGTLDDQFNIEQGFGSTVLAISQQPDGKILAGGFFQQFDRVTRNYVARLNSTAVAPAVTVSLATQTRRAILGPNRQNGILTVTRTGGNLTLPEAVYYTVSGAAQNGVDYRKLTGGVTIPANQTTARIRIKPLRGPVTAPRRKVIVTLSLQSPPNIAFLRGDYAIGQGRAVVKIIDDSTP